MSSAVGSSCEAFFCATRRICLSSFITASSARTDFSRPTNSGTIMCGNTTMSRSGSTASRSPGEGTAALVTGASGCAWPVGSPAACAAGSPAACAAGSPAACAAGSPAGCAAGCSAGSPAGSAAGCPGPGRSDSVMIDLLMDSRRPIRPTYTGHSRHGRASPRDRDAPTIECHIGCRAMQRKARKARARQIASRRVPALPQAVFSARSLPYR